MSEPARESGWRTLARMGRPRATKANALAAVLAAALGFAMVTQVHQNRSSGLDNLSQDDLVALLDGEAQQAVRLGHESDTLTYTRDQLRGSTGDQAALKAAQQRLTQLGILAGTLPAKGPGIRITVADPKAGVQSANLLDAVEELRDAGAEAIQVNSVRVVASSYFSTGSDNRLQVDGTSISAPYVLLAIGDPHTMSTAMAIPGGVVSTLRQLGATASVTSSTTVSVSALRAGSGDQYAHPDTTTSTG
ncbi:DUF881 domain-containing protein [Allobranchiibius huperziae]|uniref:Uncharacterized protein YlxW (UPF0749 family) n=1 Tax=Allobranchiibius huperziae TaxID=1874116 RepID=A0A853DHR9_9MICO|nr:DUF881 domain-containing protein [Allobranchiibius huperziae]NYJ74584.1 uncharacterized protein YlxW (UPF0749 family) [Allobranchiibius huperziae]